MLKLYHVHRVNVFLCSAHHGWAEADRKLFVGVATFVMLWQCKGVRVWGDFLCDFNWDNGMLCTCRHFLNCLNLVWLGSSSLKYEEVVYCSFLMMISLWFRFSALPSIIPRASLSLTMCSTLLFLTGGFGLETTRYFCLLTVQTHPVRECPFPPSFFDVVTSAWQVVDGGASLTEIGRCAVNLVASQYNDRFCIDLMVAFWW